MTYPLIIGFGTSGRGVARYFERNKKSFFVLDQKQEERDKERFFSESSKVPWDKISHAIYSPGFAPTHPWLKEAKEHQIPLYSDLDIAFPLLLQLNKQLIGITGTNGKTTTTLLVAHLLGEQALACGNVGVSLFDCLDAPQQIFVIELSSFQLEALMPIPCLSAAALLNITPNHLDRHPSYTSYVQAKLKIGSLLKKDAPFWVSKKLKQTLGFDLEFENAVVKEVEKISAEEIPTQWAAHDFENGRFAKALAYPFGIKRQMEEFIKPAHRLEKIACIEGITYINDSKATTVDAVIKAIESQVAPVIVIVGGVDKGGDFSLWRSVFQKKVKLVLAMGQSAEKISENLSSSLLVKKCATLEQCVREAKKNAQFGDVVLLSSGCSSYDQFADYIERGNRFKEYVLSSASLGSS